MKLFKSLFLLFFIPVLCFAEKPAYKLFDENGNSVVFSEVLDKMSLADLIFFGELHNDPIAHWLQLEFVKSLYERNGNLILGMEMFETDDQLVLTEYLRGLINNTNFEREAKLWPNYKTDIKPLIDFAKDKKFPVIATNVPRRYANIVFRAGPDTLETLGEQAKKYMAPLPYEINMELSSYDNIRNMAHGHGENYLLESQALKDATMAHFIQQNLVDGIPFFHINGSYHSINKEGIVWYVLHENPTLDIVTISLVLQHDISNLDDENMGVADYIIVVPSTMTRTH